MAYEVARQVATAGSTGGGGSTTVDANLTSEGSTRLAGRFSVDNPTTSVTVTNPATAVNIANQPTVDLSSVGSTRVVGTMSQGSPAGSSADAWWVRTVSTQTGGAGSTTVDANLTSEGSTKIIGLVSGVPFSSTAITRTTLNSSAEGQLIAANANRRYATITNMATAVSLLVGLSTAAVSTAGANAYFVIPALNTYTLGGQLGNLPRYTGPIRCRINSTSVAGPVIGVEFV